MVEPSGEGLRLLQAAQLAERLEEGLLRQILSVARVAAEAVGGVVDLAPVAVEQGLERALAPVQCSGDKLAIRQVAKVAFAAPALATYRALSHCARPIRCLIGVCEDS